LLATAAAAAGAAVEPWPCSPAPKAQALQDLSAECPGSSAEELATALYRALDELVLNINLSMVHKMIPIQKQRCGIPHQEVTPIVQPQFWKRVVDSLQLTRAQVGGSSRRTSALTA